MAKYSVRFAEGAVEGVREDAAKGMTAEVAIDGETVRNDFDAISFYDRRICNAVWDGTASKWRVKAYKGDANFAWDGSGGEVLYECKPFYISDDTDLWSYVSVCGSPCDGYSLAPMFSNPTDKVYLPCFETYFYTTNYTDYTPHSYVGAVSSTASYNSFVSQMSSYSDKADFESLATLFSELALALVEFATKDLGGVMRGVCDMLYGGAAGKIAAKKSAYSFTVLPEAAERLTVGQLISVHSSNTENTPVVSDITVTDVSDNGDGYFLVTVDKSVNNIYAGYYVFSKKYRTGVAALAVTSASSGSAVANDGKHPCIWRGKENPWGNGRTIVGGVYNSYSSGSFTPVCSYYLSTVANVSSQLSARCAYSYPTVSGRVTDMRVDRINRYATLPSEAEEGEGAVYFGSTSLTEDTFLTFGGGYCDGGRSGMYFNIDNSPSKYYYYNSVRCCMKQG